MGYLTSSNAVFVGLDALHAQLAAAAGPWGSVVTQRHFLLVRTVHRCIIRQTIVLCLHLGGTLPAWCVSYVSGQRQDLLGTRVQG